MTDVIDARIRMPRRDSSSDPRVLVPEHMGRYESLYGINETINYTVEDLLPQLAEAGIEQAVIHAEFEFGDYRQLNDRVAALVKRHPDRFIGVAGLDPRDGRHALDEIDRAVNQLGLRGLNVEPSFFGLSPNDRTMYPFYGRCQELGIPVHIHIGVHFSTAYPLHLGNPVELDEVACRFPGLKMVGMHGGWPWVLEAIAVARRHPNVYLEYGAIAPKYFAIPGAGWDAVLQFANSVLQDQVIFASDWPNIPYPRLLSEYAGLPLKESVREKISRLNVLKLYQFQ